MFSPRICWYAEVIYSANIRYAGVSFEIERSSITPPLLPPITIAAALHQRHQDMFANSDPQATVNLRTPKREPRLERIASSNDPARPQSMRIAWFSGGATNDARISQIHRSCPLALERCRHRVPPLVPMADGRVVACHVRVCGHSRRHPPMSRAALDYPPPRGIVRRFGPTAPDNSLLWHSTITRLKR